MNFAGCFLYAKPQHVKFHFAFVPCLLAIYNQYNFTSKQLQFRY